MTLRLELGGFQVSHGHFDHQSSFMFGHNCNDLVAVDILREGVPTGTFYGRGSQIMSAGASEELRATQEMLQKAAKFSRVHDVSKPLCIWGKAKSRQRRRYTVKSGGVIADHAAAMFADVVHSTADKRWAFRSHLSAIHGLACFCE